MKSNYSNVGLLEGMLYSDSMVAFAGQYRPPTSGCQTQRVGFHRGLSRRLAAAGRISVNSGRLFSDLKLRDIHLPCA